MRLRTLVLASAVLAVAASAQAAFRVSVWIPGWSQAGIQTLQTRGGSITESNPVWYIANADGSVGKKSMAEDASLRAAMTGTRIIPTIQNSTSKGFDASLAATLISTPEMRETHASAIANLVFSKAYDGIDIDYERVATAQRANFTAFVQTLAKKLHDGGKKLSVTVYAKTSDKDNWNGPGGEDWPAIGAAADWVKVMAYDYHYDGSTAGAITPLTWLDSVATYAKSVIPASKVMIALPFYGYDWSGTTAVGVSYAGATQIATNNAAAITHDANGEATFTYSGRTVYFQDAVAYQKKFDLLKSKHGTIGGIAHWAAGQEDPGVWSVISGSGGSSTNPTTTLPPADYMVAGPNELTLRAGSSASGQYALTPINGFAGTAQVQVQALAQFAGTVTASASTVTFGAPITLNVSVPGTAVPGSYPVSVKFVAGTITHEQIVTVTVQAAPPGRRRAAR